MTGSVADLQSHFGEVSDDIGSNIGYLWELWNRKRAPKKEEWKELRDYVFATDTSTTSNSTLPWKNTTTIPKICQIRDNLHSNYISSLFPNDNWLKWEGATGDDETISKKQAIQGYIGNKVRESNYRDTVSDLVFDYIDYGNAFYDVSYENNFFIDADGEYVQGYVGPVLERISPLDIVFNPTATTFGKSPKIVRKLYSVGEVTALAEANEEWAVAALKTKKIRAIAGGFSLADMDKAIGFQVDGFGDLKEYYGSEVVEVLTFEGDYYDSINEKLHTDIEIVVIDRSITVASGKIKSWLGKSHKGHVGWRKRTDNLYAMGPLDNLIGMQYRIDHLENLKADAQDLLVHPPLVIRGDVDDFEWEPGVQIPISEEGNIEELGKNLAGVISAQNEIDRLMAMMEEMAGAPKQAMGIRTPGEKTAFEVQSLDNAAGRIFQEKTINFEINILEPSLNAMLEEGRRRLDATDVVRIMDDDLGVQDFISITKDDITARGKLRPIGARHFAQQAQLLQSIQIAMSGELGLKIGNHFSGIELAKLVEDSLQISSLNIVKPNIGVMEQIETQKLAQAAQEDALTEQSVPAPGEEPSGEVNFEQPPEGGQ